MDQVLGPQITFCSILPTATIADDLTIRPNTVFSASRNTKETYGTTSNAQKFCYFSGGYESNIHKTRE